MSKRKNPAAAGNVNADFCDFLMELADYEKNVGRNIFKHNAYKKAASVLATQTVRIESGAEAKKLPGIGDKISKKIDEFLKTGKLRKLENIKQDSEAQAITLLTQVTGIGPVKAADLVRNGIRNIEDLENNKDQLNHHQLIGLKYFKDFQMKIPRSEIQLIEEKLKKMIAEIDEEFTVTICGSYRRGLPESGDIDVLITHSALKAAPTDEKKPNVTYLKDIVEELEENNLIIDSISLGDAKFMGVCRLNDQLPARRLDMRLVPSDQYYCAVLHYTGSDVFNRNLRATALERLFSLNEYRLRLRTAHNPEILGEVVPINSEEDIFDWLDLPYKKPEERI